MMVMEESTFGGFDRRRAVILRWYVFAIPKKLMKKVIIDGEHDSYYHPGG
jgi:hypothetical protein